jgi:hypothetical protein
MPSKVSFLWAFCGVVEYVLQPLRWCLTASTLAIPWLSLEQIQYVCAGWGAAHLMDRATLAVLRRLNSAAMFD